MRFFIENPGPSYLRLGKAGKSLVHSAIPEVQPGLWLKISGNSESLNAIVSTGATLDYALNLSKSRVHADPVVFSVPLWGMKFKSIQPTMVSKFNEVVTLEDHLIDGGFGSWLMESILATKSSGRVKPLALSADVCGTVGTQQALNKLGGL
jgi:transketolase